MPSITRRHLLGGAGVAVAAYGGHRLYRGASDPTFGSWTPADGTWPLRRYDPANTAHNPTATPPRADPTRREVASASTTAKRPRFYPLVGDDTLVSHGSRLETYAPDGELRSERDATTPFAGLGPDGTLHATHTTGRDTPATLAGYAPDDSRVYRHSLPDDDPSGLTVGAHEVYVGVESGHLIGVDIETGRRWQAEGAKPVLTEGRLYGASAPLDGTVAYAPRTGLDRHLEPGPERRWHTGTDQVHGFYHPPAVSSGRLVHGSYAVGGGAVTDALARPWALLIATVLPIFLAFTILSGLPAALTTLGGILGGVPAWGYLASAVVVIALAHALVFRSEIAAIAE